MMYCMQQCFIFLEWLHTGQGQTPLKWLVCMHNGVGTIIHATHPPKTDMITGGSGSMDMSAVCSLHDVLHATVFQIIGIATQDKSKYL